MTVAEPSRHAGRKLTIGSVLKVTTVVLNAVSSFLLMPFVIRIVGDRNYGIWSLVCTFVMYYGLMDFGLTSASGRYLSRALGANDKHTCNHVFQATLYLYFWLSIAAFSLGIVLATATNWLPGSTDDRTMFSTVLIICTLNISLGFPVRACVGALQSNLQYDLTARVELLSIVLKSACIALAAYAQTGLIGMAWGALLGSLPCHAITVYSVMRSLPFLQFRFRKPPRQFRHQLLSYGALGFIGQCADMLRFQLDNIVVASMVGIPAVTHYRVAGMMTVYMSDVVLACVGAVQSVFSRLEGRGDLASIKGVFLLVTKLSTVITCFIVFGLICWGRAFIVRWLGVSYLDAYPALCALVASTCIALCGAPGVALLFGVSKHRDYVTMTVAEGFVNLLLSVLLAPHLGMLGVALGTAIPMVLTKVFVQPRLVASACGIHPTVYALTVVRIIGRSALCLILPLFISTAFLNPTYSSLVIVGSISLLCYAVAQWQFASGDEKRFVMSIIAMQGRSLRVVNPA